MLKSHEKFHSYNGKRLILVADDEAINREILGNVLQSDYEVIYACDGQETLDRLYENKKRLSLLLLDLMMPKMSGFEIIGKMKEDPELQKIPVIVLTADQNAEVQSLNRGAIDYIRKPYPDPDIILARIIKAIELTEDRDIIKSTERDSLTGLYTREYFYRYAEQYDQHHPDREMDAIIIDVNHFHMINERFGTAYGDEVLKSIGERIRECVAGSDGIVCRREADTFLAYVPNGADYEAVLDNASVALTEGESVNNRVRLRIGVYANVDKSLEIERRFDRAKIAADTVRNSFTRSIAIYDNELHEKEIYAEQLIDDFDKAIKEKQFRVFYQPKFDIRPKKPVLSSAEALIRWQHPKFGLISPGLFIPLFEENGLIQQLDKYVWEETAAQMKTWLDTLGFTIPVSVNVSRVDMYNPDLLTDFKTLLDNNGLQPENLLLEITESAYTEDSSQIIDTVKRLREMNFKIEMDDFGTGYSSLNMISTLPIDALKLDMQFVRSAFRERKDTRMLEVIIDIADHLSVPVIAEGVETEEQLIALRELGCDIVQGYYFSKPVPPEQFESFIKDRMLLSDTDLIPEPKDAEEVTDTSEEETVDKEKEKRVFPIRAVNSAFVILVFILTIALAAVDIMIGRANIDMDAATRDNTLAVQSAGDLQAASDYLTESVRSFAILGEREYFDNYFEEANNARRRDKALSDLETLLKGSDNNAYSALSHALDTSNELMELEYQSMKLTLLANGLDMTNVPTEVTSSVLDEDEMSLSPEEQKERAEELVFGPEYMSYKEQIRGYVSECTSTLIENTNAKMISVRDRINRLMSIQVLILAALLLAVLIEAVYITLSIRAPLLRLKEYMYLGKEAVPEGASEVRNVAGAYNNILSESKKSWEDIYYKASRDPLTGLLNRSAFDLFLRHIDQSHIAIILVDVDNLKGINDAFGKEVGDKVLIHTASVLRQSFRSVDAVCRLGDDEFAVVMTRANLTMRKLVIDKFTKVNILLRVPQEGIPKFSLSAGAAFADRDNPSDSLFKDADTALCRIKKTGKSGCEVY
ncbi:MAG: EAL domain-containing protein [Blautia sp.]|nr:EAL domain-containing protein [Blautia sp.]